MLNRRKTRSTPNLSPHERAERQVMSETKNLSTGLLRLIGTLVALYERPASPERELAISMTLMAAAERYRSSSVYAYFVLTAQQILLGKTAPFGLTLEGLKEAVPQVWQRVDAMLARCRAAIERETPLGNKLANSTLNQINTVERGLSEGKPIEEVFGEIVEEAKQNAQEIFNVLAAEASNQQTEDPAQRLGNLLTDIVRKDVSDAGSANERMIVDSIRERMRRRALGARAKGYSGDPELERPVDAEDLKVPVGKRGQA